MGSLSALASRQRHRRGAGPLSDREVAQRLHRAGLQLPAAPVPVGQYRRGVIRRGFGMLSGQFPVRDGEILYPGLLGRDLSLDDGQAAARVAALNVIAQLKELLGSLARLDGLLRLDGFVAGAPGFIQQAVVLDGASALFALALGERGAHARSAIGVCSLPLNAPVELVVTFAAH